MNDGGRPDDVPVIFRLVYGQGDTMARDLDMGADDTWLSPTPPRMWRPGSGRHCASGWSLSRGAVGILRRGEG